MRDVEVGLDHYATQRAAAYYYRCYGLSLSSNIAFAELDFTLANEAELAVNVGEAQDIGGHLSGADRQQFSLEHQLLEFRGLARFSIRNARDIDVTPYRTGSYEMLGLPLLGPVLATVLHYRGALVLHGSAFLVDRAVTIFIGEQGAGKSTLAGCLITEGFNFFTDDILGVDLDDMAAPRARAGYPVVKLSQEAYSFFFQSQPETLPCGGAPYPKRRIRIERFDVPDLAPLARICVLKRGENAHYKTIDEMSAFEALMKHSYMAKYGVAPFSGDRHILHFEQCAALSKNVEVGVLTVPDSLDRIRDVVPLVSSC